MPKKKFYTDGMNREEYDQYIRSGLHRIDLPTNNNRRQPKPAPAAPVDTDLVRLLDLQTKAKEGDDIYERFLSTSLDGTNGRRK